MFDINSFSSHMLMTQPALLHFNLTPSKDMVRAATIQNRRPKNAANAEFSIIAVELR